MTFTDEYLTSKNKIKKQNASYLKEYDKTYRRLTADMSNKIREKLKSKLDEKSFPLKKSEAYTFSGFNEGLGDISYYIRQI